MKSFLLIVLFLSEPSWAGFNEEDKIRDAVQQELRQQRIKDENDREWHESLDRIKRKNDQIRGFKQDLEDRDSDLKSYREDREEENEND